MFFHFSELFLAHFPAGSLVSLIYRNFLFGKAVLEMEILASLKKYSMKTPGKYGERCPHKEKDTGREGGRMWNTSFFCSVCFIGLASWALVHVH